MSGQEFLMKAVTWNRRLDQLERFLQSRGLQRIEGRSSVDGSRRANLPGETLGGAQTQLRRVAIRGPQILGPVAHRPHQRRRGPPPVATALGAGNQLKSSSRKPFRQTVSPIVVDFLDAKEHVVAGVEQTRDHALERVDVLLLLDDEQEAHELKRVMQNARCKMQIQHSRSNGASEFCILHSELHVTIGPATTCDTRTRPCWP